MASAKEPSERGKWVCALRATTPSPSGDYPQGQGLPQAFAPGFHVLQSPSPRRVGRKQL